MAENAAAFSGDQAAGVKSEKSKDIRATNIIAAKGKSASLVTCHRRYTTPLFPKHVDLIDL